MAEIGIREEPNCGWPTYLWNRVADGEPLSITHDYDAKSQEWRQSQGEVVCTRFAPNTLLVAKAIREGELEGWTKITPVSLDLLDIPIQSGMLIYTIKDDYNITYIQIEREGWDDEDGNGRKFSWFMENQNIVPTRNELSEYSVSIKPMNKTPLSKKTHNVGEAVHSIIYRTFVSDYNMGDLLKLFGIVLYAEDRGTNTKTNRRFIPSQNEVYFNFNSQSNKSGHRCLNFSRGGYPI